MQRLYRSLFLIVIVNVGSYFLANFYLVVSNFLGIRPVFSFGPIQNWTIGGTLINAGALSNGIILYCNRLTNGGLITVTDVFHSAMITRRRIRRNTQM